MVAYDPDENAWGVAVASKFLAAAAVVSWAQANAGAIATQSFAKVSFGPSGLQMLANELSADEVLAKLLADDPDAAYRQVGIVDQKGNAATYTGDECFEWAGGRTGKGYACQGNILVGAETLDAMAAAFESSQGELANRLVAALLAGDAAGGDRRGKQSAGVLVVRPNGGYGGDNDRYLDLRVDDDPAPIPKLAAMVELHHLYFGKTNSSELIDLDNTLIRELQALLKRQGYYTGAITGRWNDASREAFWAMCGSENLEERADITYKGNQIDPVVLKYLRDHFGVA